MISVSFSQPDPLPVGGRVTGQVTWTPESARQPRGIKVMLRWRTEGRGSVDQRVVAETIVPAGQAVAGLPMQVPFDLPLPPDGPVSYNGQLIRVIWEVRVEIDEAWAINEKFHAPLVVVPRWIERS